MMGSTGDRFLADVSRETRLPPFYPPSRDTTKIVGGWLSAVPVVSRETCSVHGAPARHSAASLGHLRQVTPE
jgi:hypothetical protein